MQIINQTEILADMLGKRSIFRSVSANSIWSNQDYSIYLGVPAHCLTVKNSGVNCEQDFPHHVIDLLICRGKEAILAIVFDAEYRDMETLFSTHLQAVPHEFLKPEELTDDAAEDLCGDIEFRLRCDRSDPLNTGCMLYSIRIQHAISRMNEPAITAKIQGKYRQFLEEKHLIRGGGSVTSYGHACGVFRHWLTSSARNIYVTVPQAVDKLKRAMLWHDVSGTDGALAARIARLKQGFPSDPSEQESAILKKLLQTPLVVLFQNHPQDGQHLNALLNHAQFLSRESRISAFGDREDIETYGDVVYAAKNLWEYTANSDCRNADAAETCEQILAFLSFPLWSLPPKDEEASEKQASEIHLVKIQNLHAKLHPSDSAVFDLALAGIQLSHYFYAAACLAESEYPLWLYQTCVQPWLGLYASGEICFAKAMQAVYNLSQSEDENEKADYFPLLYDILVEPVSGIV